MPSVECRALLAGYDWPNFMSNGLRFGIMKKWVGISPSLSVNDCRPESFFFSSLAARTLQQTRELLKEFISWMQRHPS